MDDNKRFTRKCNLCGGLLAVGADGEEFCPCWIELRTDRAPVNCGALAAPPPPTADAV